MTDKPLLPIKEKNEIKESWFDRHFFTASILLMYAVGFISGVIMTLMAVGAIPWSK